ncbi:MAG: UDP-3-O-(3-hydroxymyristoyl)glucosamine N-acyltransferase [Bacteroidota bacterium]
MKVREIASLVGGEVVGDDSAEIAKVAKIEEAGSGDLTFLANPKYERFLATTRASAILVSSTLDTDRLLGQTALTFIKVPDPYVAFLQVLKRLTPVLDPFPTGIHPSAVVDATARIGRNVALGANVVVGKNAVVGNNTRISHGCVIGDEAFVGDECLLYPNVTVYHQCKIGTRVIIHSGVVIGSDGFGFAPKADGTYEKIPQLGIVVVEDDAEIGANCTIDRATMGQTTLQRGVKLDNLVHVAHNVTIGENTVIAAQTGISGSTKIGKNVMIAGQVGIVGHIEIADKTVIMAQSGIPKSLPEPGKTYFGYPAKEHRRALRIEAVVRSLPELAHEVQELARKVESLRSKIEQKNS